MTADRWTRYPTRRTCDELPALRDHLDRWAATASSAGSLTDIEADAIVAIHRSFTTLLTWIERCPDRCEEAGWWWGGSTLDDLALPLPDVVEQARWEHRQGVPPFLRALRSLDRKGWVLVDADWRVTLRFPGR